MDAARLPGYDLFKLIVSIILLILALILMWTSPSQSPTLLPTPLASLPHPTTVPASSTSPPLITTASPIPSRTATTLSATTDTHLPSSIPTLLIQSSATPIAEVLSTTDACDTASLGSRLHTGMNATILRRLNFRSSPGIGSNWLLTNRPGTKVEIIGGPQCLPYFTGAYVWWQIKLPNGQIGWSAEESVHGAFYFMEPIR